MSEAVPALIWSPFGSQEEAREAAGILLDEGLIACANILGPVQSLFVWKGQREEGAEYGGLFKTTGAQLEAAIRRLEAIHPYSEPAITGWLCDAAGAATRAWLGEALGAASED